MAPVITTTGRKGGKTRAKQARKAATHPTRRAHRKKKSDDKINKGKRTNKWTKENEVKCIIENEETRNEAVEKDKIAEKRRFKDYKKS